MKAQTKSSQIRSLIATAKVNNQPQVYLIPIVMERFEFSRQLARAYIKNNWDKVEVPAVVAKPAKTLSMTKDAIRKREQRAAAKAAKQVQEAVAA